MAPETSRKLLEKQQRREAEERRRLEHRRAARKRNLITAGIVVVVLIGVVALVLRDRSAGTLNSVGVAAAEAGCGPVEEPEEQGADHIDVGTQHPPYSSNPPTSGPHYATPADAAFYTTAIEAETVVHNLEHGQIVFWYRPDASQELIDQVESIVRQESLASLGVPWPQIEEPYNVVLTAWGALQQCERVSQKVVDDFREEFQGKGPESVGIPQFEI